MGLFDNLPTPKWLTPEESSNIVTDTAMKGSDHGALARGLLQYALGEKEKADTKTALQPLVQDASTVKSPADWLDFRSRNPGVSMDPKTAPWMEHQDKFWMGVAANDLKTQNAKLALSQIGNLNSWNASMGAVDPTFQSQITALSKDDPRLDGNGWILDPNSGKPLRPDPAAIRIMDEGRAAKGLLNWGTTAKDMPKAFRPPEVQSLLDERSKAEDAGDFDRADALSARIRRLNTSTVDTQEAIGERQKSVEAVRSSDRIAAEAAKQTAVGDRQSRILTQRQEYDKSKPLGAYDTKVRAFQRALDEGASPEVLDGYQKDMANYINKNPNLSEDHKTRLKISSDLVMDLQKKLATDIATSTPSEAPSEKRQAIQQALTNARAKNDKILREIQPAAPTTNTAPYNPAWNQTNASAATNWRSAPLTNAAAANGVTAPSASSSTNSAYKVGARYGNLRFKGGNPNDQSSWEPAQ